MKQPATRVPRDKRKLTLTIGIPALNEEKTISNLLKAILKQRFDRVVLREIIVNASGSTDSTAARVKAMVDANSKIRLISNRKREGKASALNDIFREAHGNLLLFIDGDVILEEDSISNLLKPFFQDDKVGICTGNTMPIKQKEAFFEFTSFFIRSLHHELCIYLMSRGSVPKVNGSLYAVRRGILNFFPPKVVSDDEYASLLAQRKGYKIVYVPDALVYIRDPCSFYDFIEWQKRIISGQLFMKRHFNYKVPTMQASIVAYCWFALCKKHKRKAFSIITLLLLGIVSFILAFIIYLRNEVLYIY